MAVLTLIVPLVHVVSFALVEASPYAGNEHGDPSGTLFDIHARRLPPRFAGDTVEWALSSGTVPGRFSRETKAEYEARLAKFQPQIYAFVLDRKQRSVVTTVSGDAGSVKIYPARHTSSWDFTPFDIHRTPLRSSSSVGPRIDDGRPPPTSRGPIVPNGTY
jgi:hypothetical protein